jgi:tRNA G18 (ribose-2'-O)-methylase SpoU
MFRVHRIESLDAPELAPYRTLRQTAEHRRHGIFVAEGEKVVRRMFEAKLTGVSALLTEPWLAQLQPLLEAAPEQIEVYVAPLPLLETLTGFPLFQGALAVGRIPPEPRLEDLLAGSPSPRLFIALDGLANAENVGVVARNAAAFGAHGLICGPTCASPWLRRAVRNSMGAVFRLPVVETPDLPAALKALRAGAVRCIAAHPHTEQSDLKNAGLARDCCLVFGSEGDGLSAPVLAACDAAVAVPMASGVDSLNVASASAAFLYETARQRGLV